MFSPVPEIFYILFMFNKFGPDRAEGNQMKLLILFLIGICMLPAPAFAQADGSGLNGIGATALGNATAEPEFNESEIGALPGDFAYGFQRFFENVDKFFTFDKAEKAKKNARYGKMRAVEAHIMAKKAQALAASGDLAGAGNALSQAEALANESNSESEDAQENIEAAVEEGSADGQDAEEVQAQLRNSIMVLQRVYAKAPEAAKDGLAQALNNSINNQERHEEKMQEKLQARISKQAGPAVQATGNETSAGPAGNSNAKGKPDTAGKPNNLNESEDEESEEGAEPDFPGKGKGKGMKP